MSKLLLVDDDTEVLAINQKYLSKEGFTVYTASSPSEGLSLAKELAPDCILLDVMMPEMDGLQLCRKIRGFSSCPVIFLTGKGSEDDRIDGLLTGADDYIVKPYSLRELKVRIDTILRRSMASAPAPQDDRCLTFQELVIDQLAHKAYYAGEDLLLANREYEMLLYLATHPNRDIPFSELGSALFGCYQDTDRRSVMVIVSRLRKKFEDHYDLQNMIQTVWSKGYRFNVKKAERR